MSSYTAKSVILDIADNWGSTDYLGIRSIDFYLDGTLVTVVGADITCYSTTYRDASWDAANVFITSYSKTGTPDDTAWESATGTVTEQRLIVVFTSEISFDLIVVNNSHYYGANTTEGANNVKIYISSDEVTDTTYDADITNSDLIFDGVFDEHVESDEEDSQTLSLYGLTAYTGDFVLTIDSSLIDEDLENFPILVVFNEDSVGSGSVEDIIANPLNVAFQTSDNETCYAEIEFYTDTEIRYWVKIPTITHSTDTTISFAYNLDNSQTDRVGETGSTAAQYVWSNDYAAVYHMCQDPSNGDDAILDSTSNENHCTSGGSMTSDDLSLDDDYGYGIAFDGSNDYLVSKSKTGITETDVRTLTLFSAPTLSMTSWARALSIGTDSTYDEFAIVQYSSSATWGLTIYDTDVDFGITMVTGTYAMVAAVYDGLQAFGYVDGTQEAESTITPTTIDNYISMGATNSPTKYGSFTINEARVSTVDRSAAWIKADNASIRNTLLTITSPYYMSGKVTDGTSVLSGASVYLENQNTRARINSTTTDENGEFTFNYVPYVESGYRVIAHLAGYKDAVQNDFTPIGMS